MSVLSSSRPIRGIVTALVALLAVVYMFPFYWMLIMGTHTQSEVFQFPPPLLPGTALLDNFRRLTDAVNILGSMWNSFFVAASHTLLILFFSTLGGYGFARFRQAPGHRWLFTLMLGTIMIPPGVGIIPFFVEMKWFGWLNTYWPLIVPGAASAFGIFWMRQYIEEAVPFELYEAAKIDGSSDWRMYWQIVLPLIVPGVAALAAFSFLSSWNSFFLPLLVLNDKSLFTIPLALTSLNSLYSSDVPAVMLGTTISVLPVIIAFLLATRHFIAGLSSGSLKG